MGYGQKQWYKDLKASHPNCIYCDEQLTDETFTVDHIQLASKGGADNLENCKPCCKFCNNLRGDMEYKEFIQLYPKEKLLKLKEYTLNNQDINGVLVMKESVESIEIVESHINKLIERTKEINLLKDAYKELSDKVRNEIAYSKNLSASEGYKLYVKQREIDRQYLRYKNEFTFLFRYLEQLKQLNGTISSVKQSMSDSITSNSFTKPIRTLEDDLETAINGAIDNVLNANKVEQAKSKAVEQCKNYKYDSTNKNQKYHSLISVWKNVEDDIKHKIFKCSGRL